MIIYKILTYVYFIKNFEVFYIGRLLFIIYNKKIKHNMWKSIKNFFGFGEKKVVETPVVVETSEVEIVEVNETIEAPVKTKTKKRKPKTKTVTEEVKVSVKEIKAKVKKETPKTDDNKSEVKKSSNRKPKSKE